MSAQFQFEKMVIEHCRYHKGSFDAMTIIEKVGMPTTMTFDAAMNVLTNLVTVGELRRIERAGGAPDLYEYFPLHERPTEQSFVPPPPMPTQRYKNILAALSRIEIKDLDEKLLVLDRLSMRLQEPVRSLLLEIADDLKAMDA